MTAAAAWEAAADSLPLEISRLLDASPELLLQGQHLIAAIPEWEVQLIGGSRNSCTDVLAICGNETGLCIIGVEAKVDEDFGPLVAEKRAESSSGQTERLTSLHNLLRVERFDDSIRYQLLHRTASALLTARKFHAAAAVMLVHAFDTPATQRLDFEAFREAMGAKEISPLLYKVESFVGPALYLAWCDGDPKFRQVMLPSSPSVERDSAGKLSQVPQVQL